MSFYVHVADVRAILAKHRIFLMGPNQRTVDDTASSYRDDARIEVPDDLRIEAYSTFWGGAGLRLLSMGAYSYVGSTCSSLLRIGRYTSIAAGLRVMGNRHPLERVSTSPVFYTRALMAKTYESDYSVKSRFVPYAYRPKPIHVGNDVWIGENVVLSHGVSVGDGAVVAANAVVTKDVAPYSVVGGIPAKPIRNRFPFELASAIAATRWWEYDPSFVSRAEIENPVGFAERFKELVISEHPKLFNPSVLTAKELQEFRI